MTLSFSTTLVGNLLLGDLPDADLLQATAGRLRILTAMKKMGMTRSSTQLTLDKWGILSTMRCTGLWSLHYIQVYD